MMTAEVIAVFLGLLVGLSLGALGGGGSTLAVPILVFVAGFGARDATTASLLVVGVAAAVGVVSHFRDGNVRLGAGVAFGVAGIAGSRLGLLVNRRLDENVLLLAFSALIMVVAIHMYRSVDSSPADSEFGESSTGAPQDTEHGGTTGVEAAEAETGFEFTVSSIVKLAVAATAVGLLTGLFGVGGGFAVVPALTLLLKFPTKHAIGTSLVVVAINAAIALALRTGGIEFDWAIVGPFLMTVTVGVVIGTGVAERIDAAALTRSFSLMLGSVAIYTAVSTVLTA